MQKPHWSACCSWNACWSGCSSSSPARSSTVRTDRPRACTASIRHDRTGSPSTCTVHAPQTPCSQPTLVPVRPSSWRSKSDSSVRGSTSASCERAVDLELDLHVAASIARRVSAVSSARRYGSSTSATRAARAGFRQRLARRRAHRHRRGAEQRERGAAGREDHGGAGDREVAVRARVLGERRAASLRAGPGPRSRRAARPARARSSAALGTARRRSAMRAPRAERTWKRASSAASTTGSSAFGSACATEPPIVPRARIWVWPTCRTACAQQRPALRDQPRRALERRLARHRADPQRAAVGVQVREPGDALEVDQPRRPREPEVEHRHQALAAGERPRCRRRAAPAPRRATRARAYSNGAGFTAARSTASPACRAESTRRPPSASATALPIAAGVPIAPPSPMPLAPERVARRRRLARTRSGSPGTSAAVGSP